MRGVWCVCVMRMHTRDALYDLCASIFTNTHAFSVFFAGDFWANNQANQSKLLALLQMEQKRQMTIAMTYRLLQFKKCKNKRKHRWWVHSIIKKRFQQGSYHNLVREMEVHISGEKLKEYFILNRE